MFHKFSVTAKVSMPWWSQYASVATLQQETAEASSVKWVSQKSTHVHECQGLCHEARARGTSRGRCPLALGAYLADTHVMPDGVDAADPAATDDKLARREGVHRGQTLRRDVPLHAAVAMPHVDDRVHPYHGARLR